MKSGKRRGIERKADIQDSSYDWLDFDEYELPAALDKYDDSETFIESRQRYRNRRGRGE